MGASCNTEAEGVDKVGDTWTLLLTSGIIVADVKAIVMEIEPWPPLRPKRPRRPLPRPPSRWRTVTTTEAANITATAA